MKKVWELLKRWILPMIENPILEEGGALLEKSLEKYYEKNPKACAVLVSALYPFIDTVVEDIAEKTDIKYDDHAVDEVKKELEEFSVRHGFVLSNLDAD